MPISDEAELKAHITAMLVVHGRTVPGEPFGMAVTRALTVQEAAEGAGGEDDAGAAGGDRQEGGEAPLEEIASIS